MTPTQEGPEQEAQDIDVLAPQGGIVKVAVIPGEGVEDAGRIMEVRVRRLKTLELLALLRVLTSGLGPGALQGMELNFDSPEAVGMELLALCTVAIPQAGHEFAHFISIITEPVNTDDDDALRKALVNPEPDVTLEVFEVMATQEADDLYALLGKVRSLWKRVSTLYTKKGKQRRSRTSAT